MNGAKKEGEKCPCGFTSGADGRLDSLAYGTWRKPDGKRVESFTIITTEPNELVRPIHNRMPVILRQEDEAMA